MKKKLILVLNCGSSSIKMAVLNPHTKDTVLTGLVQRIGSFDTSIQYQEGKSETPPCHVPNIGYSEALQLITDKILSTKHLAESILAVGHRVLHGGEKFTQSVIITDQALQTIRECSSLAPLHNPANILGIEGARRAFPELKQIAVFDTTFHQTMPEYAYIYSIPYELYQKHGIRRYGFHGTSHRFVSHQAALLLKKDLAHSAFITAHLGNGCSVAAVLDGKSIDTSMGLTPLEGLTMGTRSGDVDPSLHLHLVENLGYDIHQVTALLNKQSGLLGLSGIDSDMRTIEEKAVAGDRRAILALEIFCYRLVKCIAALAVSLGRIDALVFTGGIGENSKTVREKTLSWLKIFGFVVDAKHNAVHGKNNQGIITKDNTPVAMVVPTNEEFLIAKDAWRLAKS